MSCLRFSLQHTHQCIFNKNKCAICPSVWFTVCIGHAACMKPKLYLRNLISFSFSQSFQLALALRLPVDILHMYFEVVVPGELLMAQLALCHGPVWVVCELMPAEHLLQAE